MIVHIGTSGWSYDHWQGVLYPPPANATTPSTIKPSRSWQRLPQRFLMTLKAPRGRSAFQASLFATEVGGTED